jgi:hypothetical protein
MNFSEFSRRFYSPVRLFASKEKADLTGCGLISINALCVFLDRVLRRRESYLQGEDEIKMEVEA